MRRALPRLLLITDRRQTDDLVQAVARALTSVPPGSTGILLREKDLGGAALARLARQLRTITRARGAALFLSSRFDIALAIGADGVHLGGDAPPFESVRRLTPHDLHVGVSLHGDGLPPADASYALLSPIYPTRSKPGVAAIGLEGLRRACTRTAVPLFALGGVKASNVGACRSVGAWGGAVLGDVLPMSGPGAAAMALVEELSWPFAT